MKRSIKALALVGALALAVFAVSACGSPEVSRSSESLEVEPVVEEKVETVPTYILVVGNDSRYGTSEQPKGLAETDPSFSDTIMVMRVDPDDNRIGIVSIPRDTAYDLRDGTPEKINATYFNYGIDGLSKAVEELLGVDISYTFEANFVEFANLVDKLGGITVNVPMGLTGGEIVNGGDITLSEGEATLDGPSALMLSRQRKVYPSGQGEGVRQMISREMVANAIQAVADQPLDTAGTYVDILQSTCKSSMTDAELKAYIEAFMDVVDPIDFTLGTTTTDGYVDDTGLWRVHADPDACAAIVEALENGGDISEIVPNPSIY